MVPIMIKFTNLYADAIVVTGVKISKYKYSYMQEWHSQVAPT
jgi:hypothetical protein